MKRLHRLKVAETKAWVRTRRENGRAKYGDAHLKRYGALDVAEELLDAGHILDLMCDRIERSDMSAKEKQLAKAEIGGFQAYLLDGMSRVMQLDKRLPDSVCTDENGGERVGWPEDDQPESEEV